MLDIQQRELRRGPGMISITPQVFDLLEYLIRNRDRVLSKDDLIDAIWKGRVVSDAAVTTRLNAARSAIGDSGEEQRLIKTLPRKGFRFVGSVQEAPAGEAPRRPDLVVPHKPSIAVLPFANLSSYPEQEYLVDGIVDDIITELSRSSALFVIARNSSFQYKGKTIDVRQVGRELGVRYVLEGSVRRVRDRIRVSAQLIEAVTGVHRWAEHYDRTLEDVFGILDEVVRSIVALLAAHVRQAEIERSRVKAPNSWEAYDYYLRAVDTDHAFNRSAAIHDLYETRLLLHKSLAIDPNNGRAYALLTNTQLAAWANPLDSDFLSDSALDHAHQFARKAISVDPNLPEAHASLGFALVFKREFDASIAAFERALALNPNYLNWPFGLALVLAGDPRRAIDILNAYVRLDPLYSPYASAFLGLAHYMLEEYAQALPFLRDCVSRAPNMRQGHVYLAATCARMGKLDEARAAAAEVMRIMPNYSISRVPTFKDEKYDQHLFEGLRKAGLPD